MKSGGLIKATQRKIMKYNILRTDNKVCNCIILYLTMKKNTIGN